MNNVIQINRDITDKRYTTAKGLQKIFIGLGRSTIDDWAKDGILITTFYEFYELPRNIV
jgi:hypothetical protein